MEALSLNKNDITTIRTALPDELFSLLAYMQTRGWGFNVTLDHEAFGYVSFKKEQQWHDRPMLANDCRYGYAFDSRDEAALLPAARRSAELCLSLYDLFVTIIPGTPDIHGKISPDFIINTPVYDQISYADFVKKHQDKQLRIRANAPWSDDAFCFTLYRHVVTIENDEKPALRTLIKTVRRKLDGRCAFEC
jgi:hypothetical protein